MAHGHTELGSGFRSLTRYEEYYLPGGDLFLLVEHHVFRVHRYFFERESTYFKAKLTTPASPGSTRPGTSESNAILLDDVRVHEFARFLWVFYNPKYSLYNTSVADWAAILDLAHRWSFPEVKALAVRELEKQPMDDIDRVVVYQNNQVDRNLLIPCYTALSEREGPLTPAEGRRMGIDTALTIAQLREMARRSPIDCRSPTSANIRGNELHPLVRELFSIAERIRDDDSVPQTPLGGPTRLWPGPPPPATAPTAPSRLSTARPPPVKSTTQTAKPAPTPQPQPQPPIRAATPPLPAPPAQELETHPLDPEPTPPPPLPEKPERPQVITNPALAKVSQQTETSRPSTPAPETSTTATGEKEKKKKKKTGKKGAAAAEKAAETAPPPETGSAKPNGEPETNAAVATEATQQQQESQGGEKKDDSQVPLLDLDKTDEAVAKDTSVAPGGVPSTDGEKEKEKEEEKEEEKEKEKEKEKEEDKADVVTSGDGVSTDIPNTTTDPAQEVKPDPSARSPLHTQRSPLSPNRKRNDKHDYLKSPEERTTPGSLVNNLWNTFTS